MEVDGNTGYASVSASSRETRRKGEVNGNGLDIQVNPVIPSGLNGWNGRARQWEEEVIGRRINLTQR